MKIEHHPSQQTAAESLDFAQICGFGQRLGAFIIDLILLWIVGKILGFFFFEPFTRMGEWGVFVGLAIALLYFGIFNSAARQGQTLGKFWMRIEVVDRNSRPISLKKSFIRSAVMILLLWSVTIMPLSNFFSSTVLLGITFKVLSTSLALMLVLFYIFNRQTRQSLHDLVVDSYVVECLPTGPIKAPPIWKGYFVISVLLSIGLSIVMLLLPNQEKSYGIFSLRMKAPLIKAKTLALNTAIRRNLNVHQATITEIGINQQKEKKIEVLLWPKDFPKDQETITEIGEKIVKLYLGEKPMTEDFWIVMTFKYGYDLGIAEKLSSYTHSRKVSKQDLI
ncbi:MAG: RDD family protein [bacterium]